MIFQSNLDLPPETIYEMYMQRWTIEEMFRLHKNIEEFDDTRVHSDFSVIAEHFDRCRVRHRVGVRPRYSKSSNVV